MLTEEEVLAEDAAMNGVGEAGASAGLGAANVEMGGDEEVEGKEKGKAVLVEEEGAVGPLISEEEESG